MLDLIVDRRFLAEITWSGRSTPGKTKISFSKRQNILDFMYKIANQKHPNYSPTDFKEHMVDGIFKFAYKYVLCKNDYTYFFSVMTIFSTVNILIYLFKSSIPDHLLTEEEKALKEAKKMNRVKKNSSVEHHGESMGESEYAEANVQPKFRIPSASMQLAKSSSSTLMPPQSSSMQAPFVSHDMYTPMYTPMYTSMYHSSLGHGHRRPKPKMHDLMANSRQNSRGRMMTDLAQRGSIDGITFQR